MSYLKRMKTAIFILYFLLLATSSPLRAHTPEEGMILATPAILIYRTVTGNNIPSKESPYKVGGGLIVEGDVNDVGGIEIALIYQDKYYLRRDDDNLAVEKIKRMYITTGYRYWPKPWISLGLAFASSYSMGNPRVIYREHPSDEKLLTSAQRITEYGVDFSVQWDIWHINNWHFVSDIRYTWSLTRKPHESADLYGIMLGIKYRIPKDLLSGRPEEKDLDSFLDRHF